MPNPFPGVNPYLETAGLWEGFHSYFIGNMARALNRMLPPPFYANSEDRIYVGRHDNWYVADVGMERRPVTSSPTRTIAPPRSGAVAVATIKADAPFVAETMIEDIREPFLVVRNKRSDNALVLVAEVLSPTNKQYKGEGRDSYLKKQRDVLGSEAHLMEIDLLLGGQYTVGVPQSEVIEQVGRWDYIVSLHRARVGRRERFEFWPFTLRDRLPCVLIPLTEGIDDIVLDLQAVFEDTYEIGTYEIGLDYDPKYKPLLRPDDAEWADAVLREQGLRS